MNGELHRRRATYEAPVTLWISPMHYAWNRRTEFREATAPRITCQPERDPGEDYPPDLAAAECLRDGLCGELDFYLRVRD